MGHQANFYATPTDIAELQERIAKLEPMAILHSRSPTATPRVLPSLRFEENSQAFLHYYLVREGDFDKVVTEYVPTQGYWSIEELFSPVVELSSCFFDGNILRQGRVYYKDGFYGPDGLWVDKPEPFRTWAKAVLRHTKKLLKKHGRDYIGKDALRWVEEEGGKLCDGMSLLRASGGSND
ncbi:MAG: hypothetical protein R3B70_22915 [Polyangiaceae bacterium]